jgi:hypothetical protein
VLGPRERSTLDTEIAVCPSQRSAQVYVLVRRGRRALMPRLLAAVLSQPAVDLVLWREGERAVIGRADGRLRFAPRDSANARDSVAAAGARGGAPPGERVTDERGGSWEVEGDFELLGASLDGHRFVCPDYPDALARIWSAVTCPTAGDVLLSAAEGFEFIDWGGVSHVGGSSHGSLHASDSLAPLIFCGTGPRGRAERERWSIADVAPAVTRHFESAGARP